MNCRTGPSLSGAGRASSRRTVTMGQFGMKTESAPKCDGSRLPNDRAALHENILAIYGMFSWSKRNVARAVASRNPCDGECHVPASPGRWTSPRRFAKS